MRFGTIVLPIDLASETPSLVATCALARRFHSRVVALYVKRPEEPSAAALAKLGRIMERDLRGVATRCLVRDGQPAWQIVEMAARVQADAVALFPRGETQSVGATVLREARCAIWALSARAASRPFPEDFAIRGIVCGVGLTPSDRAVVPFADAMARELGASLTLAHALPDERARSIAAARDEIAELQRALGVRAETFAETGDSPIDALNRAAIAAAADLLIVGRAGRRIVREAVIPVLAVPT